MFDYEKDPAFSKPVLELYTVANEFLIYLNEIAGKRPENIYPYFQKILPLLYLKGSLIPELNLESETGHQLFTTEDHWEKMYNQMKEVLGNTGAYWLVSPDNPYEAEPLKADIAEQIADVYQDLQDFVWLYQKNTIHSKKFAVYHVAKYFYTHWGYRISQLMPAIHFRCFTGETEDDGTTGWLDSEYL